MRWSLTPRKQTYSCCFIVEQAGNKSGGRAGTAAFGEWQRRSCHAHRRVTICDDWTGDVSSFGSKLDPPPWKSGSNEWPFAGVKRIVRYDMVFGKVEKMSSGAFSAGRHFTTPTVTRKAGHQTSPSLVPASSLLFQAHCIVDQ